MEEDRKNQHDCGYALSQLVLQLEDPDFSSVDFEKWKSQYPACQAELTEHYRLWTDISTMPMPEPSEQMRANFYAGLSAFEHKKVHSGLSLNYYLKAITEWLDRLSPSVKWAMVAGLFFLGILLGKFAIPESGIEHSFRRQLAQHGEEPAILSVNYNTKISTAERLKNVQATKDVAHPDERVLQALNQALLSDPNINVRLSAIESLVHFADHPMVREYLIKAIPQQSEPLVQIALADAMLLLQESRSQNALEQLLNSNDVDTDVKIHVKKSLKTL